MLHNRCINCGFLMKECPLEACKVYTASLSKEDRNALKISELDRFKNYNIACYRGMFDSGAPGGSDIFKDIKNRILKNSCDYFVKYKPGVLFKGYENMVSDQIHNTQYRIAKLGMWATIFATLASWGTVILASLKLK